jgi:Concanavalin A-like lectin/glucanases superfamily
MAARVFRALLVIVLTAGAAIAPQVGAHPAAAAHPAPVGEAEARAAAVAQGHRVEATALTTQTGQVFANPDGTFTRTESVLPVRVRRASSAGGDGWTPVDTTLVRTPDGGVAPVAAALDMTFSGGGKMALARLRRSGSELALRWPGSLPTPELSGDTATYRDVVPGVDLTITVNVTGFSQLLVVKTAEAARSPILARLRYALATSGVSLRTGPDGLSAVDRAGVEIFSAPAPYMWDGQQNVPGGQVKQIPVEVVPGEMSIIPDAAMLTGTRFPLYIDPSWSGSRSAWTQVWSNYPTTSFYNGANLGSSESVARVGYDATDGKLTRSFFKLDTTGVKGKHILKATLQTYETWSRSCTTRQVEVWATNSISSSTTWNNQPTWAYRMDYHSVAKGYSSSCPAGGVEFNVTTQIVNAAKGNWDYVTQGLRASSTAETNKDTLSWKKFRNNPTVTIDYNTVPAAPTNLTTESSATCVTGSGRLVVGTTTPTLRATVSDADNAVMAHFQWWTLDGTTLIGEYTSASVAGKTPTAIAKTIPAGAYANGGTGKWRIRAEDGTDVSVWSPWCEFAVDTTRPPIPRATSSGFPDNGAGDAVMGTSLGITFSANGDPDVSYYEYVLNGDQAALTGKATPPVAGGSVSIDVVPDRYVNWLHLRSVDAAGNRSDLATVVFYAAAAPGPIGDWAMDETGDLTTAVDTSGGGRDATLGSTASWTTGRYGGALHLDGTSTAYAVTSSPVVDTTKSFSVSAWVRLTSKTHNAVALTQVGDHASAFALYYSSYYDRYIFNRTTVDADTTTFVRAISTTVPAADGNWVQLTGVYDAPAQQLRLYVNGILEATTAFTSPWSAAGPLQIGRSKVASVYGENWPGDIDNVQVYQRILLPGEFQQVARLDGQWKLDETSGTTAADTLGRHPATWSSSGVTRVAGVSGNAVAFSGTGSVLTTSGPVVRTDGSYTIAAWVRPDALTKNGIAVSQLGTKVGGFNLGWSWNADYGAYLWSMRTSEADASGSAIREAVDLFDLPTVGQWTHLTVVYDAKVHQLRLYVNGQAVAEAYHASTWNAGANLLIGRGQASDVTFSQYLIGTVDDVRAYSGVLTDQEIYDLYSSIGGTE